MAGENNDYGMRWSGVVLDCSWWVGKKSSYHLFLLRKHSIAKLLSKISQQ
jgi:hypothetical protein